MHDATANITRADLAGALVDVARANRNVAMVLAVCESWEPGYVASLLGRAETLAGRDHRAGAVGPSVHDRSLSAIDRCIRHDNPFQRVQHSGVLATAAAVDALIELLDRQARFHDIAGEMERRWSPRA